MNLLLDSHTLIWWARDNPKLPALARSSIARSDAAVSISAASLWEIAIKHAAGRWDEAGIVLSHIGDVIRRDRFRELKVTIAHARAAGSLPRLHKDPFDRMLIAQAIVEDATIVSADRVFSAYAVPVLWA